MEVRQYSRDQSFDPLAYQSGSAYAQPFVDAASKRASALSALAGDSDESEQPKKKRKQYQACDACRLRRVRCERDEGAGEEQPCRGCRRRGFACTREYNSARSQENRSGKLLNQAKVLFSADKPAVASRAQAAAGSTAAAASASSAPSSRTLSLQSEDIAPLASDSSPEEPPLFAYDSAEGRLGYIQAKEFVANDLVHTYRRALVARNPIMEDFEGFLDRFEQSGRRLEALQANDKALSALVLALASRITDLPVIAGAHSPKLSLFLKGAVDSDATNFGAFGANRESVCRALETRARSCVEQRFMNRHVSVQSITALMAQQGIEDVDDPETFLTKSRPYSAAAIEQLRTLSRKEKKTKRELFALHGPLMKAIVVTDSMWGLPTGRALQVSDEDLAAFHPNAFKYSPMEAAELAYTMSDSDYLWLLVDQMFMLARRIRRDTTSPLARLRNATLQPSFYVALIRDVTAMLNVCDAYKSRGPPEAFHYWHWQQSLRACEFGFGIQLARLHWQCEQTMRQAQEPVRSEYLGILSRIYQQLQGVMETLADSSKYLCDNGMLLGNNLLWSSLSDAANILLKLPSDVEGGPSSFPLQRKVDCVENMLRSIRQLAYSWPSSVRALPDLEHRASVLKAMLRPSSSGLYAYDAPAYFVEQRDAHAYAYETAPPVDSPWMLQNNIDVRAILNKEGHSGSSGSSSAQTPASDAEASIFVEAPLEGPPLALDDRFWQSLFSR